MSLENIKDILRARVEGLDSGKHDIMTEAKLVIVDEIRVEVRVLGFKNGILRVVTEDAPAASEIRMHANTLVQKLNKRIQKSEVKKLYVIVR